MQTARCRGRLGCRPSLRKVLPWLEFAQVYGRALPRWSSPGLFQYRRSFLSWNADATATGDVGTVGSSSRRCSPCYRSVFMFRQRAWFVSWRRRRDRNSRKIFRHDHGTATAGGVVPIVCGWGRHVGRNEEIVCTVPAARELLLFLRARRGFQIHPTRLDQNCLRFGTKRLCYGYLLPLTAGSSSGSRTTGGLICLSAGITCSSIRRGRAKATVYRSQDVLPMKSRCPPSSHLLRAVQLGC